MDLKARAQGTIEYLVILAVIVVISLFVVNLMVNSTSGAAGISEGISAISTLSAQLAISEISMNPDGNVFMKLVNNVGETINVTSIIFGEDTNNYSQRIGRSNDMGFILHSTSTCVSGQPLAFEVEIIYSGETGLEKRQVYGAPISVPCEEGNVLAAVATAIS